MTRDVLAVLTAWLERPGRAILAGLAWVAARAGWPFRGAGRAMLTGLRLAFPRYNQPATSAFQVQARAKRGCIGLVGLFTVPFIVCFVAVAWLHAIGGTVAVGIGVAACVAVLGWVGRPPDEDQATDVNTVGAEQQKIAEALASRLPGVTVDALRVSVLSPVYADDAGRVGRTFTIGLPLGNTADQVMGHRSVIAGALGSRTDRVKVTEGASPAQAIVFVADKSPSELPPARWSLTDAAGFDLAQPVPIGQTMDGKPVGLAMFGTDAHGDLESSHMLITGSSGKGKSSFLQLILTAAALDDRSVIHVAALKSSKDFRGLAPALTSLTVGTDSRGQVVAMLREATLHMKEVGAEKRPAVPYFVVIDECQEVLGVSNGDSEIKDLVRTLLASGRSSGISVILCTQIPTKTSIEPNISERPQIRVAFHMTSSSSAIVAMGAGMSEQASPNRPETAAKGVAAVATDDFKAMVRMVLVKPDDSARIATEHRRESVEAEFPTYPLDHDDAVQDPEPAPETVLDHLDSVWLPGWDRGIHCADLVAMLTEHYPGQYAGLDVARMNSELRRHGLEPRKGVKVGGKSATGIYWADLVAVRGGSREAGKQGSP